MPTQHSEEESWRERRDLSRRERAEVKFCNDFPTEALEGVTLEEVVNAAMEYVGAEYDVVGAGYANDQGKLEDAYSVANKARSRLEIILSRLTKESEKP